MDCTATLVMDEFSAIGYNFYNAGFTDQAATYTETDPDSCVSTCGTLEGVLTFPAEADTNGLSALVTFDVATSKLLFGAVTIDMYGEY